jgi:hypothetical protein
METGVSLITGRGTRIRHNILYAVEPLGYLLGMYATLGPGVPLLAAIDLSTVRGADLAPQNLID